MWALLTLPARAQRGGRRLRGAYQQSISAAKVFAGFRLLAAGQPARRLFAAAHLQISVTTPTFLRMRRTV